ncbi:MAG: 2Fe-2S iron-sulfur cluster-binding protein [Polyangiaceae bacterium]
MPTFKLDGREIPFQPGETIIAAAAKVGIEIPHYCWHAGLSIAANCRMCLVEIMPAANQRAMMLDVMEWDANLKDYVPQKKPKLQPSCQIQAAEGMDVRSDSSGHVKEARAAVQEFLLLNHPVDCPICDQSGECKLQDYWLEHGQFQKRMRDEPVHKSKGVSFGPTIVYDGERCVMCTRCIRFMDEVAKDPVLDMRERGNLNEIFVSPGRELDGKYTFMVEHVCPVGALTTKDFRFKARVWFLRTAETVCQGCATGCNAYFDYDPRYNKAYRHRPRDNEEVNKFWMCDDGMLSYRRAHEGRVTEPRMGGRTTGVKQAMADIKARLAGVPTSGIAFVFSAQHSLEDNWALRELGSVLLGSSNAFLAGQPDGYEDTILIHKDKNPNTAGVRTIVPDAKPWSNLMDAIRAGQITHVVALGGATPGDSAEDVQTLSGLATLVAVAAHDGPLTQAAHVVLPAASWAESAGVFVNAKGLAQYSDKALDLQGSSQPGWQWLAKIGQAVGVDATWTKVKEIRARLGLEAKPQKPLHEAPVAPV